MKVFDKIDKGFVALMRGTYYFMKIAFGLVVGAGFGLIFLLNIKHPIGTILFFVLSVLGLICGIWYAIKISKQKAKDNSKNHFY